MSNGIYGRAPIMQSVALLKAFDALPDDVRRDAISRHVIASLESQALIKLLEQLNELPPEECSKAYVEIAAEMKR